MTYAYPDERAAFMKGRPSVVAARMGSIHYFDGQSKEWGRDAEQDTWAVQQSEVFRSFVCYIDRDAQGCQGKDQQANAWT